MKPEIKIKVRAWLELEGENVLGDGRLQLLRKIDENGSISAAARELGMSYRNAWGIIRRVEERLGLQLVNTHLEKGQGRGARITPECRELMENFGNFRKDLDKSIKRLQKKHFSDQPSENTDD